MKILCLFVRHGTTLYPDALPLLDSWYERHGLLAQRTLWIIDNALDPNSRTQALGPGTSQRPGDNRAWEFSAWERALREAEAERVPFDVVHLVTSAFNTLYTGYLDYFHREMMDYVVTWNICLGHIDSYAEPIQLNGTSSQSWVRTCFFFLARAALNPLPTLAAYVDPMAFFPAPASRLFLNHAPLSVNYQQLLTAWLEGQEMGGHSWHSPVQNGGQDNARFQRKVLAILNEHKLAITLRRAGIPLVDFWWLHLMRNFPSTAFAGPPPESKQLKIRRRFREMID